MTLSFNVRALEVHDEKRYVTFVDCNNDNHTYQVGYENIEGTPKKGCLAYFSLDEDLILKAVIYH